MSELGTTKRRNLAIRRWVDLGALALVSASGLLVALAVLRVDLDRFVGLPLPVLGAAVVCIVIPAITRARGRVLAFLGLRHFATYPPLWVAWWTGTSGLFVALGLSAELGSLFQLSGDDDNLILWVGATGLLITAVLLVSSLLYLLGSGQGFKEKTRPMDDDQGTSDSLPERASFATLCDWVRDDTPVEDRDDDRFGHHHCGTRNDDRDERITHHPVALSTTATTTI